MQQEPASLPRRVHLVGIAGAGMSGLAHCLLTLNHDVSGSDLQSTAETEILSARGTKIFHDHAPANVAHAELVVVSNAISSYNVEVEEARQSDIPILKRAECLDRLCASKTSVFVAGSHGKSTTSGMIASVLEVAGAEPSFVIGGTIPVLGNQRARIGRGDHFIAEACEAFGNLACYNSDIALILNVDDDHLEHYGSQGELDDAFRDFAARAATVIVNGDDGGLRRILPTLAVPVTTFGLQPHNEIAVNWHAFDSAGCRFELRAIDGGAPLTIALPIPGEHMIQNALACIAVCYRLGISLDRIAQGLASFTGVSRRWEDYGVVNGIRLIDDYAHHPTELSATIRTARSVSGNEARLVVAFQPQLFSRTQRLYQSFARVLVQCDHVLLLDIDPAGEHDAKAIRSKLIADEIRKLGGSVEDLRDVDDLVEHAPKVVNRGDVLLISGAGSIRTAAPRLRRAFAADNAETPSHKLAGGLQRSNARGLVGSIATRVRSFYHRRPTVISRFRAQARQRPQGRAISDVARTLDYRNLDRLTDALARILRARGAVRGAVVGVRLPASIDLVAVLMALMKTGAIYLPLAESLPLERTRYMLKMARAKLVIVSEAERAIDLGGFPTLCFSDLQQDPDRVSYRFARRSSFWPFGPSADEAAYICFTSGSTGYPKGITIAHEALARLIADAAPLFHFGAATRTLLNTSISFDVSLAEIWMTLCSGGELVVGGSQMAGDRLGRTLNEANITHLMMTPSVLASLGAATFPTLRCIVCAGEACPQGLVDQWAGGRRFFNAYGPTETTIYATAAECQACAKVTIGTPLQHVNAYVLDKDLHPVPRGEIGELCIGGAGVAEGYLGSEEENRHKFLTLCRDGKPSDRIYRTGDFVKEESDGNLSFLGRADNQIKIRGNRIELEEIEHSVQRQPGIVDAAVCIDESGGTKKLICFVVSNSENFDPSTIATCLSEWLPSYMVPSDFLRVDAIPLTESGKKDRRSLLPKHRARLAPHPELAAPRTDIEHKLVAIWKDVLEAETGVGVYDNFGLLGGDSLKSLMLIEEVEQQFGILAPPGYFGRISTIYRMAVQIADLQWTVQHGAAAAGEFHSSRIYKQLRDLTAGWAGERIGESSLISSLGEKNAIYDVFLCVQYENEFVDLARHMDKRFRFHCMRSGHLVMDYTSENIERLATHYFDEIQKIGVKGQFVIAGICQGGTIAHALANKLQEHGQDVALLVYIEQGKLLPFDGNVAFFYAERSPFNPRNKGGLAKYDDVFGDRYTIDWVPGEHGRINVEPEVQLLAATLQHRLDQWLGVQDGALAAVGNL